jgi:hypothetical protein
MAHDPLLSSAPALPPVPPNRNGPYRRVYLNVFAYMKDEYEMTSAGRKSVDRVLRDHGYDGAPMDQYPLDPSDDTAGAAMEAERESSRAIERSIDISYGGHSEQAVSEKQVLCEPLDFSCFFGFSR